MRKVLIGLVFCVSVVLLFGCGKDGDDGEAYLSFTWDWSVEGYNDNNHDTPSEITERVNYWVCPGAYYFEYLYVDGYDDYWVATGTYTIRINEGESGGFFMDGDDGEDNYYRLNMTGTAWYFYLRGRQRQEKRVVLGPPTLDMDDYRRIPVGEAQTEVQYSASGEMTIVKQLYRLERK